MARIVCVHGIAQELKSRESLLAEWSPSLCGGVSNAGGHIEPSDIDMAFYGLLFRPSGGKGGEEAEIAIPNYKLGDIEDPLEVQLLENMFDAVDEMATDIGLAKSGAGPRSINRMLQVVSAVPYFGKKTQSIVIWFLKQVRRYFTESAIRNAAQRSLTDRIAQNTEVIVAHSLGTVVAYEALCASSYGPACAYIHQAMVNRLPQGHRHCCRGSYLQRCRARPRRPARLNTGSTSQTLRTSSR